MSITGKSTPDQTKDVNAILKVVRKRMKFIQDTRQAGTYRTLLMCLDAIYPGNKKEVFADLERPVKKSTNGNKKMRFVGFTAKAHPDVYQVVEGCSSCTPAQKAWYEAHARKGEPLRVSYQGKRVKVTPEMVVEKFAQDKDEMLTALFSLIEFSEAERLDIEQESAEEIGVRLHEALGKSVSEVTQ